MIFTKKKRKTIWWNATQWDILHIPVKKKTRWECHASNEIGVSVFSHYEYIIHINVRYTEAFYFWYDDNYMKRFFQTCESILGHIMTLPKITTFSRTVRHPHKMQTFQTVRAHQCSQSRQSCYNRHVINSLSHYIRQNNNLCII